MVVKKESVDHVHNECPVQHPIHITQHAHATQIPPSLQVLTVLTGVLLRDAEERASAFNSRPYFRIMVGLLSEFTPLDNNDVKGFAHVMTCAAALHAVQPLRVPGFAFAWLELIAHRALMPKLLTLGSPRGWGMFHRLLSAALRFLEPYLRSAELTDAVCGGMWVGGVCVCGGGMCMWGGDVYVGGGCMCVVFICYLQPPHTH